MTWSNQPICTPCWVELEGNRVPVRIVAEPLEVCCMCESLTTDGIYVRRESGMVPFPSGG